MDFLEKAYLPLLNRLGPQVEMQLVRPGFYPAGGGKFTVRVQPGGSSAALNFSIAAKSPLAACGRWSPTCRDTSPSGSAGRLPGRPAGTTPRSRIDEVKGSHGPGNVVMIELEAERLTEVFTAFGQLGVRAEDVAREALRQAEEYLAAGVPVGKYLADQLLLPLGIGAYLGGGGVFRTMALSRHSTTHLEILQRFLDLNVHVKQSGNDDWLVRIGHG